MNTQTTSYEKYKDNFLAIFSHCQNEKDLEETMETFCYGLRMFWLQRPDKIHESNYSLYICVTNEVHGKKLKQLLANNFKPLLDATPMFSEYCHSDLILEVQEDLKQWVLKYRPELESKKKENKKWWRFW